MRLRTVNSRLKSNQIVLWKQSQVGGQADWIETDKPECSTAGSWQDEPNSNQVWGNLSSASNEHRLNDTYWMRRLAPLEYQKQHPQHNHPTQLSEGKQISQVGSLQVLTIRLTGCHIEAENHSTHHRVESWNHCFC